MSEQREKTHTDVGRSKRRVEKEREDGGSGGRELISVARPQRGHCAG